MKLQGPSKNVLKRMKSHLHQYITGERGTTSVMMGVASIPLIAVAGIAIDYNRVTNAEVALQGLADRAALAAASTEGDEDDMEEAGEAFATTNPVDLPGVTYTEPEVDVDVDDKEVTVTLDATIEGSLFPVAFLARDDGVNDPNIGNETGSAGDWKLPISATAKYTVSGNSKVCLLALDPHADNAIYFRGTGNLEAAGCGVHSDSDSPNAALHTQGSSDLVGDFFQAVGTWKKTGAAGTISDGDGNPITPASGKNRFGNPFNLTINCPTPVSGTVTPTGSHASPTTLSATSYNNITMGNNRGATFTAGVKYIFGRIWLRNGGKLTGNGVTLVMCGPNAYIDMNGGELDIKAPTTGLYPGFAVVGHPSATRQHNIGGNGNSTMIGIWYTPEAKVNINGTGGFNEDSKYFPVIAKQIETGGTGDITIAMDYAHYGYAEPTELNMPEEKTVWLTR